MLTSGGTPSLKCSGTRAGAAIIIPAVVVMTVISVTSAYAEGVGGTESTISHTSCIDSAAPFNCVTQSGPASDPYVRLVPRPVDETEKARAARDRKWLARCRPVVEHDGYGVARYRYAARGCEFGVDED